MKDHQICVIVRTYNEEGDYSERRYDDVSWRDLPRDTLDALIAGEVVGVQFTPEVEAFYFAKPKDWSDNWAELGECTVK